MLNAPLIGIGWKRIHDPYPTLHRLRWRHADIAAVSAAHFR
jgi:hypothetical protein